MTICYNHEPPIEFHDPADIEQVSEIPEVRTTLQALKYLSPRDRHIFIDRISGDTWREMAYTHHLTVRTIRRRVRRIVMEIRGLME